LLIETAPKDGTGILGFDGDEISVICWDVHLEYWGIAVLPTGEIDDDGWAPTHWMPLPEAPNRD
jgi:hypothetical protein